MLFSSESCNIETTSGTAQGDNSMFIQTIRRFGKHVKFKQGVRQIAKVSDCVHNFRFAEELAEG